MAKVIVPRPAIVRGSLVYQLGDAQFAEFKGAACAWSAVQAVQVTRGGIVANVTAGVRS